MPFTLTTLAQAASSGSDVKPQLVLEIEGYPCIFSTTAIKKVIRYGDPDLEYGEGDVYGGFREILAQETFISFQAGTSQTIKQQLDLDKGTGGSISSMRIALVDLDGTVTRDLLTPDDTQTPTFDLLGRRCRVWYGFDDTEYKKDFITIFRGVCQAVDSKPGLVTLNINHPDDKKKAVVFNKADTEVLAITGTFDPADVNTGTETITATAHAMVNGDPVSFSTTGALPPGLESGFIVGATVNTFQVAETVGGTPYDITGIGSGVHSFSAGVGASRTVINATDTTAFQAPVLGPDGLNDLSIKYYIRIDDEIIRYEATTATQFQTLTRGNFNTTAASHSAGASVESFIELSGNAVDLALKLMFSGVNGPMFEDQELTSFVDAGPGLEVPNSIYFQDVNIIEEYGLVVGDYFTTTGASFGTNNVTLEPITALTVTDDGSYLTCEPTVDFTLESASAAVIDFRSQYDTLGDGAEMKGDEVDVLEHLNLKRTFLSSAEYQFFIKDEIKVKDFLAEQIYNPLSAYSVPRKSKSSVGFHLAGQLPGTTNKVLSTRNVLNASKLSIKRSTSKNFFNAISYKFEEDPLEEKLLKNITTANTDSLERIPVGPRPLIIEATGLREVLGAVVLANSATARRLKKFKFGAEYISGIITNLKTGFNLEVGDTNVIDMSSLQVSDIDSGTRSGESRIFQFVNKVFDLRSGESTFEAVDTNFDKDVRYGLIGPCSLIKVGISTTQFTIEETGNSLFGSNEFKKWEDFVSNAQRDGTGIKVHNKDYTLSAVTTLKSVSGNTITVDPALPFTPTGGMYMELDEYDTQIDEVKLLYGFMTDAATFADGKDQYLML
jgi:hypothetical protein